MKESTFYQIKGYPGLKNTAHLISEFIPNSKIYVEPFAGLGRLMGHVKADKIILNDKSDYAVKYLKKFNVIVTKHDFVECIKKYDSKDTFFLIDPPWRDNIYKNNLLPFSDRKPIQYYEKLFELFQSIKGNWILCCDKNEQEIKKICSKSKYYNHKIELNAFKKVKMFNRPVGVLLTSNIPFKRHHQTTL